MKIDNILRRGFIFVFILSIFFQVYLITGQAEENIVLNINIPDYEVSTSEGYDVVTIPGGRTLCMPGDPIVPYYIVNKWYPDNYKIQNVTLLEKSGLKTETGLNIENYKIQWGGNVDDNTSFNSTIGWYPKQNYTWFTDNPGNGSTQLAIIIFPFFYNNATKESIFYNQYRFQVEYITSNIEITSISMDKYEYDVGENATVNLRISNSEDQPKTIIVAATVKKNEETVDYLPLKELEDFQGLGEVSLEWNTSDVDYGRYEINVDLRDLNGFILDRKVLSITIGIPKVSITNLQVSDTNFTIGENLTISASIINNGNVDVSGSLIIEIRMSGNSIETLQYPFENLSSGETKNFQGFWDTSSAIANENYSILGYVSYGGKASLPVEIQLTSLPMKNRETPGFEIYVTLAILTIIVIVSRKTRKI